MQQSHQIAVINAGSTSTKLAVYKDAEQVLSTSLSHPAAELDAFATIWDQYDYRRGLIEGYFAEVLPDWRDVDIISVRGGNLRPVPGGVYRVEQAMFADMKSGLYGAHPCSVVSLIAYDLGNEHGVPVVTVDPPATDELCPWARYSGLPQIRRISSFHALSQKATARKECAKRAMVYEDSNLIVVHMGGGISVGAHQRGKIIDVNNALDGDGAFSGERAGSLPNGDLIRMCFSGQYTQQQMLRLVHGQGGLYAYLGTTDCLEIERRMESGDDYAREVLYAMAYQVSKEIGAAAAALKGEVEFIAFTGNLARSSYLMDWIGERVRFIAPIALWPGENEMQALADGALAYLRGEVALTPYQ
ncbi:MAG: butyrate kinase [Oscillospiraceae bacterium]|jgi:butyrate kinase|nr:butyrate kinase [Oscillospiraceae bacterium]